MKYAREIAKNENSHLIGVNDLMRMYENTEWKESTREEEKAAAQLSVQVLFELEPRVKDLFEEAKAVRPKGPHFCANWLWLNEIKPKLLPLVGWARG